MEPVKNPWCYLSGFLEEIIEIILEASRAKNSEAISDVIFGGVSGWMLGRKPDKIS